MSITNTILLRDRLASQAWRTAAADPSGDGPEATWLGGELFDALVEAFIAEYGPEVFAVELPGILAWAAEGEMMLPEPSKRDRSWRT